MGLNRAIPASATTTQTHTPSGLSSPPLPVLDMSSSIKTEPSTHLDVAMKAHCHSENWAESYQDLSSWCSATSASSPATCPSPVTDETFVTELNFQGEIDFDLRKSEEIASIPLEEDNSFNLWGAGSPLLEENSPPTPSVSAVPSTEESNPVLLKDCWWSEVESGKVVKELESSKPQNLIAATDQSMKNLFNQEPISAVVVKKEVIDTKENMNPIVAPQPQAQLQPFLSDPVKMAELQMRIERIASIAQPGGNSKSKAADLMKLIQGQIFALNKKKVNSPAAISDLHNHEVKVQSAPSVSAMETQRTFSQNASDGNADAIFQSDPFDGLFTGSEAQAQAAQLASSQMFYQNTTVAPAFIQNTFHASPGKVIPGGNVVSQNSNLFFEAHHNILKEATKPQLLPHPPPVPQIQVQLMAQPVDQPSLQPQVATQNQVINQARQSAHLQMQSHRQQSASGPTIQRPPLRLNMPDLDAINFDALLFGSPGTLAGVSKMQTMMSTPEVLKPLVDTPELENFDLLSYLCDDKVATPPVGLDNSNPFHFPQTNNSLSTMATNSTAPAASELKSNVMVVRPLSNTFEKKEEETSKSEAAVVVEVKPQIRPIVLSDVEEEEEVGEPISPSKPIKEDQISSRPSRSSRKRKYSEEEFELSPSPSEENPRPSRRRRTTSSKYDSDEDFTVPSRKSPKKSLTSISEEEDNVKVKRPRSSSIVKRGERSVSTSSESDRYRELRDRNNEASRKSRLTRKAREMELGQQAEILTRENRVLKVKVDEMESLVKKLREALLQSMMNKKT